MARPPGSASDLLGGPGLGSLLERSHVSEREMDAARDNGAPEVDAARVRALLHERRETFLNRLRSEPWGHDFFQAVRRLESLFPELPRVGLSTIAGDDAVRFSQEPSLSFAPATVWKYLPSTERAPPRLFVNFLGLLGPDGPMPLHMTEFARDRERHSKDPTLARFLDVFNHRMVSLFYRGWASAQMTASFDRATRRLTREGEPVPPSPADDRFATYVASLIGLGMEHLRNRDSFPDGAKLHYSGRLVPHVRNAEGLALTIEDYFRVPTSLEEFVGQWLSLPKQYWLHLGRNPSCATLGRSAVLGRSVWDCQGKFALRLGPMSYADYCRMLPHGRSETRLQDWIRFYAGDELAWEARLVLRRAETPSLKLTGELRLGYTTWLTSGEIDRDPADLCLRPRYAKPPPEALPDPEPWSGKTLSRDRGPLGASAAAALRENQVDAFAAAVA
ncbi:MAG: type VI secretion system baseplate subunit TssG [Planctomycetota bacterium]|nr:type VI secretion system baseplate subunit TssG [Planctomycetota bacterium]